jgi:hypothetical protein
MLPTPYDMRWTSKIICRDLKGLTARFTNKVRSLLSSTSGVPDHTVRTEYKDTSAYVPPQKDEVGIEPPIGAGAIPDTTYPCAVPSSLSCTVSDSNSTLPTEVSHASLEGPVTLYSLLSQKLKDLYASRERDLPHMERWIFRSAWLVLHVTTQYCASNRTLDVLNPGSSHSNETALLLEVLGRCICSSSCQLLIGIEEYSTSCLVEPSTSRVSRMPTMPSTKGDVTSKRHDSVHDTILMKHLPNSTLALFWYTIFVGATDRTKTVQAAESLLGHVWPEKDASALFELAGNPARRLPEDDNTELRKRLGLLLYPDYNALC